MDWYAIGEALALTKSDIDLDNGIISINKSYTRFEKEDNIYPTKTPKSVRKISVHEELVELMKEYMDKLPYLMPNDRLFELSKHTTRTYCYKNMQNRQMLNQSEYTICVTVTQVY